MIPMKRRCAVALALAMSSAALVDCNTPTELPPPLGAPVARDAAKAEDSTVQALSPNCHALGGRCVDPDPGGSCPIQITGKDPCGSGEGGSSSQICCTGY
jgi:hypothetical protein